VYVVCTGVARCRQGVSSAALATHCLGRGIYILPESQQKMLVLFAFIDALAPSIRTVPYKGSTFSAAVVPAKQPNLPPLVLLPPIGVGIDRTFCGRFLNAWAADAAAGAELHAIDMLGMGDSDPKPKMKQPFGGWDLPPRTPREWAEQVVTYVQDSVGKPCIVIGQSNLCTVALEAAAIGKGCVVGIILIGPPAVEALSIDKPQASIDKVRHRRALTQPTSYPSRKQRCGMQSSHPARAVHPAR
jgi:pimeloyl-ACP methyl ester carboxylesterase